MSLPLLRKAIPKAKLTTPEALLKWGCCGLWGATWWHLNSRERKRVESRCLIQVGLMLGMESSPQVKVVLQVSKGFTWAEAKASGVGWIEIQDLKAPPRALKKQATQEQSRVWETGGQEVIRVWISLQKNLQASSKEYPASAYFSRPSGLWERNNPYTSCFFKIFLQILFAF